MLLTNRSRKVIKEPVKPNNVKKSNDSIENTNSNKNTSNNVNNLNSTTLVEKNNSNTNIPFVSTLSSVVNEQIMFKSWTGTTYEYVIDGIIMGTDLSANNTTQTTLQNEKSISIPMPPGPNVRILKEVSSNEHLPYNKFYLDYNTLTYPYNENL